MNGQKANIAFVLQFSIMTSIKSSFLFTPTLKLSKFENVSFGEEIGIEQMSLLVQNRSRSQELVTKAQSFYVKQRLKKVWNCDWKILAYFVCFWHCFQIIFLSYWNPLSFGLFFFKSLFPNVDIFHLAIANKMTASNIFMVLLDIFTENIILNSIIQNEDQTVMVMTFPTILELKVNVNIWLKMIDAVVNRAILHWKKRGRLDL